MGFRAHHNISLKLRKCISYSGGSAFHSRVTLTFYGRHSQY